MINTAHCLAWVALAIATLPREAQAELPASQPGHVSPQPDQPPQQPLPEPQPEFDPQPQPETQLHAQRQPPQVTPQVQLELPEELDEFDESEPLPVGYTKVHRKRKGLIIGGAVAFGVTYGITAYAASVGEGWHRRGETNARFSMLYIPLLGPFVQVLHTPILLPFLVASGTFQTAGAVLLIIGLTRPRSLLVRNDQLSIAPLLTPHASGVTLSVRF